MILMSNYFNLEVFMADIKKDMNLKDLLNLYPQSARVFAAYGIGCLGCSMASFETIEQGISAHGINIDEFIKDLNDFVKSNS
jgi:hybrid cluster-associated redox disulfide protein